MDAGSTVSFDEYSDRTDKVDVCEGDVLRDVVPKVERRLGSTAEYSGGRAVVVL